MSKPTYGYHKKHIEKGVLGEFSKVQEELEEFKDALDQKNPIMALVELSDLYGAIKLFLQKHYPEVSIDTLECVNEMTFSRNTLHECKDIYRIIMKRYLNDHHPSISMMDLKTMNDATTRSFQMGHRTSKE